MKSDTKEPVSRPRIPRIEEVNYVLLQVVPDSARLLFDTLIARILFVFDHQYYRIPNEPCGTSIGHEDSYSRKEDVKSDVSAPSHVWNVSLPWNANMTQLEVIITKHVATYAACCVGKESAVVEAPVLHPGA